MGRKWPVAASASGIDNPWINLLCNKTGCLQSFENREQLEETFHLKALMRASLWLNGATPGVYPQGVALPLPDCPGFCSCYPPSADCSYLLDNKSFNVHWNLWLLQQSYNIWWLKMFKISLSAARKAELQKTAIFNNTSSLKLKIPKRYLESGNRF